MPTYNKLVRDLIPNIIEKTGKEFSTSILTDEDYIKELRTKLQEEVTEYLEAEQNENAVEELADILELMKALAAQHDSSLEEVERVRQGKAEKRGAFNEKIFLIEVEDE